MSQRELTPAQITAARLFANEIASIEVYSVKIFIEKPSDLPERLQEGTAPRQIAVLKLQLVNRIQIKRQFTLFLPVVSAWCDPHSGDACKMHMLLKRVSTSNTGSDRKIELNPEHASICESLASILKHYGPIQYTKKYGDSNVMQLSCDTTGTILRYGVLNNDYANVKSKEDYRRITIFNSKSAALVKLLERISEKATVGTIGGIGMINFQAIDDEFMEAMGFEPVPDVCGRGVSMWRGDIETIVDAANTKTSRYLDYSTISEQKKNAQSFLDILQEAIES